MGPGVAGKRDHHGWLHRLWHREATHHGRIIRSAEDLGLRTAVSVVGRGLRFLLVRDPRNRLSAFPSVARGSTG